MFSNVPVQHAVNIEFQDISFRVRLCRKKGFRTILNDVSGCIGAGQLTTILGPSGAGKTTLLNVLTGYKVRGSTGKVLVNGKDRNENLFRKYSCYIMQEDLLHPNLTVHESIAIAANLKLKKTDTQEHKRNVVKEVIEALNLENCKNTRCNIISGGERKRVCIGLELVNNPPVMFFDEPTSGLDSTSSMDCVKLLKSLASGGRTIICTIHQPSASLFEIFDRLFVIAAGQFIYRGLTTGLLPYLEFISLPCKNYHNPADYVIEIASTVHRKQVSEEFIDDNVLSIMMTAVREGKCDQWDNYTVHKKKKDIQDQIEKSEPVEDAPLLTLQLNENNGSTVIAIDKKTTKLDSDSISGLQQFIILFKRSFICIYRDKFLTLIRLVAHILVGLMIGFIYKDVGNEGSKFQSQTGFLFLSQLFLTFTSMITTVLTFPMEMKILIREHLNSWYNFQAFFWSKTLADLPFQIFLPIIFISITYFLTDQPADATRFTLYCVINVLNALVAQSMGLAVGAAFNTQTAVFIAPVFCIPQMLFSGFFIKMADIPFYIHWLLYTSYMRYSFEGCFLALYGVVFGQSRDVLKCSAEVCFHNNSQEILNDILQGDLTFWDDVIALICLFFIMRIIAFVIVRIRIKLDK